MDIREVDADDADLVDGVVGFYAQTDAVDCPWQNGLTARSLRVFITRGWDTEPERFFAGLDGTDVVAAGQIGLPTRENTGNAWFGGTVRPDLRRRGLGSEMYAYLEALATDAGRTVLGTSAWDTPAARAFATGRGYEQRLVEIARLVDSTAMPPDELDGIIRESTAQAQDYELQRVVGPLPDELVDAYLDTIRAINDAPVDDLTYEDEVIDADRVRYYEATQEARGFRLYRILARHRGTGVVAGHTVVAVEGDRPHLAEQHDTTVVRGHRGHRLGLLLKAEMMRWLRDAEPQLRSMNTQNAESNSHMIAVNERLGYVPVGRRLEYQRESSSPKAGDVTGTA